jgi:hypothetical protein
MILDDFEVGLIAVLLQNANIARVERAGNGECHGTFGKLVWLGCDSATGLAWKALSEPTP